MWRVHFFTFDIDTLNKLIFFPCSLSGVIIEDIGRYILLLVNTAEHSLALSDEFSVGFRRDRPDDEAALITSEVSHT